MFAAVAFTAPRALPVPANANTVPAVFVVGRTYWTRSACDHDCIFRFEVVARTAKTVTLNYHGRTIRRGVRSYAGVECVSPLGSYSMAPVIHADKNA